MPHFTHVHTYGLQPDPPESPALQLDKFPHIILPLIEENKSEADRQGSYLVPVERALQEFQEGKISPTGRATISVPNFAAIVSFLQMSDMVAIAPRRLALWAAANAPLFLLDPLYPAVAVEIEMVWDRPRMKTILSVRY